MPTYDYACTGCGYEFELVQRMSDPARKRCPKCRAKVERRIGAGAGLIFKGSGFYITDYRSKDYKAREVSEKQTSSISETTSNSSATKSDSGTKAATEK